MVIAQITLDLRLQAHSLKEKRKVVKSLLRRMAQHHNLSVHEADCQDLHQRALLVAAWAGSHANGAHKVLEHLLAMVEDDGLEVLQAQVDIL